MKKPKAIRDTVLTTMLNDLLQLDVDAVQAYALVIRQLESAARKQAVRRFQADHKRHITSLKALIRAHGGVPIPISHIPTGAFKLAMQATASLGGDRAVLLVFKTNERPVRDRYRRAANRKGLPPKVTRALKRAATDEARHYRWAEKSLQQLGAGRKTAIGKATKVAEVANAKMIDSAEGQQQRIMLAAEAARRTLRGAAKRPARATGIAAAVVGVAGAAVVLKRGGFK